MVKCIFFVFQFEDVINSCFNFNEPQPTCDYKRYANKKRVYMKLHKITNGGEITGEVYRKKPFQLVLKHLKTTF